MIEPQAPTEKVVPQIPKMVEAGKRDEWVWVWSFLTLGFTLLPFVWAALNAPAGTQFMGFLFNATDGNSYLAKMQQGHSGWLFHLSYSPEQSNGSFVFVTYLLLGHIAALLNISDIIVYHVARLIFGLGLLLVSYRFISIFFQDIKQRRLAFLLTCFGAGIGWLLVPFVGLNSSVDTWVAESLTFFSILSTPHYPLATSLLLLSIIWLYQDFAEPHALHWKPIAKAATTTFLLGWVHPFLVISLGAIMGFYLLRLNLSARNFTFWKWAGLVIVGVAGIPGPLYTFIATNSDPVLRAWMSQNQTLSPWPWFYLTGYGVMALLAAFGAWKIEIANKHNLNLQNFKLFTTWIGVTFLLLYLPVSFQRRFVEGLQLPFVILAVFGFYEVFWVWFKKRSPKASLRRWSGRLILVCSISTLLLLLIVTSYSMARQDVSSGTPYHPFYYYNEEVSAMEWLGSHTKAEETVIAGPIDGNYIPARAGNHVFYGHELETIDRATKAQLLMDFFQASTSTAERENVIHKFNLHYLYYGLEEKHLLENTPAFNPDTMGWPVVFQNKYVTIYKLA